MPSTLPASRGPLTLPAEGEERHEDCQGGMVLPFTVNTGRDLWGYNGFCLGYIELMAVQHPSGAIHQVVSQKHCLPEFKFAQHCQLERK